MGWLLSILKIVLGWIAPYGLRLAAEGVASWFVERQEKKKKEAERKQATEDYNKERMEAKDDEQAQKDAFDKFVNRTK